jgi:uncharacterized protein (DUF433 family)
MILFIEAWICQVAPARALLPGVQELIMMRHVAGIRNSQPQWPIRPPTRIILYRWFRHHAGVELMTLTANRYIVRVDAILGGEPIIVNTRTPVRAVVELWRMGGAPESIPDSLPHLTLAQVFDALSYYSDHQEEINAYIERNRVPDDLIHPRVKGP